MFDMLTRSDLFLLHTGLYQTHTRLYERSLTLDPLSHEWEIVNAAQREITETAAAVFEEIGRRDA